MFNNIRCRIRFRSVQFLYVSVIAIVLFSIYLIILSDNIHGSDSNDKYEFAVEVRSNMRKVRELSPNDNNLAADDNLKTAAAVDGEGENESESESIDQEEEGDRPSSIDRTKLPPELKWLLKSKGAVADIDVDSSFNSYGISSILDNSTQLQSFLPFEIYNPINVWDLFTPEISCPDLMRVGRAGDGGKWICGMNSFVPQHDDESERCIVYSFGISVESSFEEELLTKTNCEIFAFDPSIGRLPSPYRTEEAQWEEWLDSRFHFHKMAVGPQSGTSSIFSLMMNLFDIMHQYRHSYIDILKVDIEGSEWKLFHEIFHENQMQSNRFPVGQILIELHYDNMPKIDNFFSDMKSNGFYSFSREINLQPAIAGNKPFACEYAFINIDNVILKYASPNHHPKDFAVPLPHTHQWHDKINGLIYILTQSARFDLFKFTLGSFYKNVWKPFPYYPIVVFHDDLTEEQINLIKEQHPDLTIRFIEITLELPYQMNNANNIPDYTTCAPKTSTLGYRHMCYFHAARIHDILFADPIYSHVEYIMRLDDDSLFKYKIGYDLFKFMKVNEKKYGFVNIVADDPLCVTDLWNITKSLIESPKYTTTVTAAAVSNPYYINRSHVFYDEWEEPHVFYNNFEISHSSVWKNPIWKDYIDHILSNGGIYYHRWGDAPIHSIGVSLILSKKDIHSFQDISYQHNPFIDQFPTGLAIPSHDPFMPLSSDGCKYYSGWVCDHGNGNGTGNGTISGIGAASRRLALKSNRDIIDNSRVLFTFGHRGRENLLIATIRNLYSQYLGEYPNYLVIFSNSENRIDERLFTSALNKRILSLIKFHYVKLHYIEPSPNSCVSSSPEVRGASYFLRYDVFRILSLSYKYEWFFRFADDAVIKAPITGNLFDQLQSSKRKYAFLSVVREQDKCIGNYWTNAVNLCKSLQQGGGGAVGGGEGGINCTEILPAWPQNVIIYNNFEISHSSVWKNRVCKKLDELYYQLQQGGNSDSSDSNSISQSKASSAAKTIDEMILKDHRSDALVHSMCILSSLDTSEIWKISDIEYEAFLPKIDLTTPATGSLKDKLVDWNALDPSTTIEVGQISSQHLYEDIELPSFDDKFKAQRFGWLGADISASVPLPSTPSQAKQYLWLFGDTMIGTSSPTRRTSGQFIANTIATVTLGKPTAELPSINPIDKVQYYWDYDDQGTPSPIFVLTEENRIVTDDEEPSAVVDGKEDVIPHSELYRKGNRYWPLSGIPIVTDSSAASAVSSFSNANVNLLIVGQVVKTTEKVTLPVVSELLSLSDSLSFEAIASAVVIVTNPYDSPNFWKYQHVIFPNSKLGVFDWIAVAESTGTKTYAVDTDHVYFLGTHRPQSRSHGYSVHFDVFSVNTAESHQVLGRYSVKNILSHEWSTFEILCQDIHTNKLSWVQLSLLDKISDSSIGLPVKLYSLFPNQISEASFHFDKRRNVWLITSLQSLSNSIQQCYSTLIQGPWVCELISDISPRWKDFSKYIIYGAKVHPELVNDEDKDGGMVITYLPNEAKGIWGLFSEPYLDVYTPKFHYIKRKSNNVASH